MKKIITILSAFILTTSCNDNRSMYWVCNYEQKQKVLEFVTKSLKDANNMSDEEMEDVISELRNTGVELNCTQLLLQNKQNGSLDYEKLKLDTGLVVMGHAYN